MLIHRHIDFSSLSFDNREIYGTMGYGNAQPDSVVTDMVGEVLSEIKDICRPQMMFQILEARTGENRNHLSVEGAEFSLGGIIGSYIEGLEEVCVFVTTAGCEYEAYLHGIRASGDIFKEYVADSVGSVIAEACVSLIDRELDSDTERKHTLPYSPGYCGWNIREQKTLFSLFPERPCGVVLSDSCLMSPIKSVSGFFGIGTDLKPQPYRCDICRNKNCYKRKER